ncbi:unnamed protein product [Prunus armeniaca]|uniref:Uncharacterized protein n=1 Tax=Prunus armeniaca TaxID=36596 RepID=A0A6J5VAE5_PRUAR|nr:unnamed protein product [Prunus armeniaca]
MATRSAKCLHFQLINVSGASSLGFFCDKLRLSWHDIFPQEKHKKEPTLPSLQASKQLAA